MSKSDPIKENIDSSAVDISAVRTRPTHPGRAIMQKRLIIPLLIVIAGGAFALQHSQTHPTHTGRTTLASLSCPVIIVTGTFVIATGFGLYLRQKQANRKIILQQTQLQGILDASSEVSIIASSPDGLITLFNCGAERLTGYTAEEMVGKKTPEAIHLKSEMLARCEELTRELGRPIEGFEVFSAKPELAGCEQREWTYVKKDGSHITVSLTVTRIHDKNDNVAGFLGISLDVTAQKQAKQQMEQERDFSNNIINNTPSIISCVLPDGTCTFINPAGEKITGYSKDELIGKNWFDILYPDEEYKQIEKLLKEFGKGEVQDYEMTLTRKDGTKRTIAWNSNNRLDQNGNIIEIVGFGHDVTRRKHAEDTLLDGDKQFMKTFYNSVDATLLIEDGVFVDCNEKTVEMLRAKNKGEVLMTHPSELSPETQPDGRPSFEKAEELLAATYDNGSNRFEWTHRRLNGELFPVEVTLMPVSLFGKQQLYCMWKDITEQKLAEENRKRTEVKFQTLYESSSDAIMLMDENAFIDCNKATLKIFGCKDEAEFYGKHPSELSPQIQPCGIDSMTLANEQISKAMQAGSNRFEWLHQKIDGTEFSAEVLLNTMKLNEKVFIQAVVRDISERKQAEEKLKKTLAEVEQFNKLMITREGRVIEMKKEVNALLAELGREPQYSSVLEK